MAEKRVLRCSCLSICLLLLSLVVGDDADPVSADESGRAAEADGEGRATNDGRVPQQPHEDRQRLLQATQAGKSLACLSFFFFFFAIVRFRIGHLFARRKHGTTEA